MTDGDRETAAAALAFGPLKDRPTPELLFMLDDEDWVTRTAAALILQGRGEPKAFERGLELCRSESDTDRETGAFLLRQFAYSDGFPFRTQTIPVLENLLLNDNSAAVRAHAAMGLGHLKADAAFASLARRVDDPDPRVRGEIAVSLGRIGRPEAEVIIEELRKDKDSHAANRAEIGLEFLFRHKFGYEMATNLGNMLGDPALDIAARKAAAELLTEHDPEAAFERAAALMASGSEAVRTGGVLLLGWLGWRGDAPHRPEIVDMLENTAQTDPSAGLRGHAARALAEVVGGQDARAAAGGMHVSR